MKDKDIVRFIVEFREGLVDGKPPDDACYTIYYAIQCMLSVMGVNTGMLEVTVPPHLTKNGQEAQHFVLQLSDGRILDPTADQFPRTGFPAVYLGPLPSAYKRYTPLELTE
jgi:hypothetical protein